MKLLKKAFLFVVGVLVIGFEETAKAVEEAVEAIEEQREKFGEPFARTKA